MLGCRTQRHEAVLAGDPLDGPLEALLDQISRRREIRAPGRGADLQDLPPVDRAPDSFEVPDDLIRLSVGIEHVDDLLADLERMLGAAG